MPRSEHFRPWADSARRTRWTRRHSIGLPPFGTEASLKIVLTQAQEARLLRDFVSEHQAELGDARAWLEALELRDDGYAAERLRSLFHRVAGAAACVGLRTLGTMAALAEEVLALGLSGKLPFGRELKSMVARALTELRDSLAEMGLESLKVAQGLARAEPSAGDVFFGVLENAPDASTLALFRTDHLVHIRAGHGPWAASHLCAALMSRLQNQLPPPHVLYGLHEGTFAVLLGAGEDSKTRLLIQLLLQATGAQPFQIPGGSSLPLTLSVAVGERRVDEGPRAWLARVEVSLDEVQSVRGDGLHVAQDVPPSRA